MTLELNKVTEQIEDMGRVLDLRLGRQQKALPAARELLRLYSLEQEELRRVARSKPGRVMRCASPGDEPLADPVPAPIMLERATIVGVDGSQIDLDRHGLALYYAINVGSIIFRHGSGLAPDVATEPELCYTEERLYPDGSLISADLVSAERDLAEMRVLADLAQDEPVDGPPRLLLADGSLLIWLQQAMRQERQARILNGYLGNLDRLHSAGATLAGFVSRPRSAEVVALLYLAQQEPGQRPDTARLAKTEYSLLSDRGLFGFLQPGERSALFVRGTAANEGFRAKGHEVWFFYLNTGTDVARIEVPEWVVKEPEMLRLVHSAVYDQCCANNGYPYVLTRADEQAIIPSSEREALEAMIVRSMARQGLPPPQPSPKAQQKQVARWRRR
ncbi:DNA double-strand break repair nuclease NurA [Chloroflexota bacterium]